MGALVYTTLLPYSPKVMLNVESDDYGELEARSCGCVFEELGLRLHLHTLHSYEKLTAAGTTFLGAELRRQRPYLTSASKILPLHVTKTEAG